jgi:hypothetical protein
MNEDPTKFEHESHAALDRAEASIEQVGRILSGEAETPDEYQVAYDTGWSASMNKQRLRIEALRAASEINGRVTAAAISAAVLMNRGFDSVDEKGAAASTVAMATEFLTWLEADKT